MGARLRIAALLSLGLVAGLAMSASVGAQAAEDSGPFVDVGVRHHRRQEIYSSGSAQGTVKIEADKQLVNRYHGMIDAVTMAFAKHYPLVLSPDCIWLTIEQGFSHHITENAEALRDRLVRHQGKEKLSAPIGELSLDCFQNVIGDFSAQIRNASDPVLHETLICDFSTTTPTIRTASEVVLMDAYSNYFAYEARFVCGIPKITLMGTQEDWQRIRSRVEVLATYGLEWWVRRFSRFSWIWTCRRCLRWAMRSRCRCRCATIRKV